MSFEPPPRLRRIRPHEVRLGMYVHGFEGNWLDHPFWRTHFLVDDVTVLERLRLSAVPAIVVDDARSATPQPGAFSPAPQAAKPAPSARVAPVAAPSPGEINDAHLLVQRSKLVVEKTFQAVTRGTPLRIDGIVRVVEDVSTAIGRNPTMLIGITRLKTKDEYTYLHSISVGALLVNFARELGLDAATGRDLGIAGVLHDIGKMRVPDAVLNKPGPLDEGEFAQIRGHPDMGHRILLTGEDVPDVALDVCRHHHEKFDGGGYPDRLPGDRLSLYARMSAICDVYDAMTSVRSYKNAMAPADALSAMYSWEGHFDPALLFRFMNSIGVYPTGALVRLRSDRLAIVLPNGRRASRPRLSVFHCAATDRPIPPETLVLMRRQGEDDIVALADPAAWSLGDWPTRRQAMLAAG